MRSSLRPSNLAHTFLLALAVGASLPACDGCAKKPVAADAPLAASADPAASASAAAATDPSAAASSAGPAGAKPVTVARSAVDGGSADAATASAAPSGAPSGSSTTTLASAAPVAASASAAPAKSSFADEIPKPCTDGMGRLGLLTFTDQGGGRVRISSSNNASASCMRAAPTQYQCDWVIEGKPTGSFTARFDPAHKSVNGSIAKGKMFTCPPSSQR